MAKKPKTAPTSAAPVSANDKRRVAALAKRNKAATHSGHIEDLPQDVAGKKIKVQ